MTAKNKEALDRSTRGEIKGLTATVEETEERRSSLVTVRLMQRPLSKQRRSSVTVATLRGRGVAGRKKKRRRRRGKMIRTRGPIYKAKR